MRFLVVCLMAECDFSAVPVYVDLTPKNISKKMSSCCVYMLKRILMDVAITVREKELISVQISSRS